VTKKPRKKPDLAERIWRSLDRWIKKSWLPGSPTSKWWGLFKPEILAAIREEVKRGA